MPIDLDAESFIFIYCIYFLRGKSILIKTYNYIYIHNSNLTELKHLIKVKSITKAHLLITAYKMRMSW